MTDTPLKALTERLMQAQQRHSAGDIGGAAQLYRLVMADYPDQPDALHGLGTIALQVNNPALALTLFDGVVKTAPHYAMAHAHRALALRMLGRAEEALAAAQQALSLDPGHGEALDLAACLWREKRQFDLARDAHERAMKQQPGNGRFYNNYAITLAKAGWYKLAHAAARTSVDLLPGQALPLMTLGNILGECGYPRRAIACYQQVRQIDPSHSDAWQAEGRARLAVGDIEQGWALLEQRPFMTPCNARLAELTRWCGQPVDHLLIIAEQGHGDSLMFARYLPLAQACAARVSFVVPKPLQRWMHDQFPDIAIYDPDEAWPDINAYELILSLPYRFGARLDTLPPSYPCAIRQEDPQVWNARLTSVARPRIGIVWAGNPVNSMDHRRSMPFETLSPVVDLARSHLVSLQKGPGEIDLAPHHIFDAAPYVHDFTDTAAALATIDLLITVDTATAHLAATMGKPVWLMLAFDPDWRWMLERADSPWYPTARLFRQSEPGSWSDVVERVASQLADLIAGDQTVLDPPAATTVTVDQNNRAVFLDKA